MGVSRPSQALEVAAGDERASESPQAKALRGRLMRDELTDDDKRAVARATVILEGRAAGRNMKEIAEILKEPRTTVSQFARGGIFRVISEHLTALEVTEDEGVADEMVRKTRTALKSMSGHVREYVAWASRKNVDGVGYQDEGAAMWAAQYLSKANGLDNAERAARPTINVHIDTIQAVSADIKRDLTQAVGAIVETAKEIEDTLTMENGA